MDFIQTKGEQFVLNGKPMMLRGWALGSWMNFEHFMMGMPGTNTMILEAFEEIYGKERKEEWLDRVLQQMVSEADIQYLKSIGVNSIRIPFGYHYLMDDMNPGIFLEEGFERLDRVVQLCAKNEMYVILDLHSTPGSQNTDWHSDNMTGQALFWKYRCFQDQAIWLWEELSTRYADNPWIAGYDILNEPGYDLSGEQINGFYQRVIEAIRRHDQKHILFLEGIDFGRDFTPLMEFADEQIALTVHFYPFVLETDVLDQKMDDKKRMKIFTEIFDRQLSQARRFHRPIWCGESGYEILDGQEAFYAMLLEHNISICESRGISWNLWTYKDARRMGIIVPQKDSQWIMLREKLDRVWNHDREQKISMEVTNYIGEKYYSQLSDQLAYDLDFRIRSVLHKIAVEQILKPALSDIPWEKMREYPDDFSFERCEKRGIVVDRIKKYIHKKEEHQ